MLALRPWLRPLSLLAPAVAVFWGPLFEGRVLYFRDVSVVYLPDFVFLERWLRAGIWPLWNHVCDGGAPFLKPYPLDLLLVLVLGAAGALAVAPPLHIFLAMWGGERLASDLGRSPTAAWLAGVAFGLSGLMLSSLLYPAFLAAAWAPWVVLACRALAARATPGRIGRLALVVAVQLSTFGAEVVLQTALLCLLLLPRAPDRRTLAGFVGAAVLALALAAPAWVGALAQLRGTARAAGFDPTVALGYSTSLPVLLESIWPRLFGDPHTMTQLGYWGESFYPGGHAFYAGLYLGLGVWLLALLGADARLGLAAGLGILLSLGASGPFAGALASASFLRVPAKFFLLTTLAVCLMAAHGLDRLRRRPPPALALLAPGLSLLALAGAAWWSPAGLAQALAWLVPEAASAGAMVVAASTWPWELLASGLLVVAAAAAVAAGPRTLPLGVACIAIELLKTNAFLVPTAAAGFYAPRPQTSALVNVIASEAPSRMYSFGVAHSPTLSWDPGVVRRNRDEALFALDRQALFSRSHVLDGLESALDIDRIGWAPPGATLAVEEADPQRYRRIHPSLRRAGVRFVLSFLPLPADLVVERARARYPEVAEPLLLYELREPLPRVFHVPQYELTTAGRSGLEELGSRDDFDAARRVLLERPPPEVGAPLSSRAVETEVRYARPDPHTILIEAATPPGFLVLIEGFDASWQARGASGHRVPVLRANERSWAIPTPGGAVRYEARYRPGWLAPALATSASALLCCGWLLGESRRRRISRADA